MLRNRANLHMGICIILASGIALAYLLSNQTLLLLVVIITCICIITSKVETKLLYVLFFLPWLQVLKLNPVHPSFFNLYVLLYILTILFWLFLTRKKLIYPLGLSLLLLISCCLFSSLISNNTVKLGDILSYIAGFTIPFIFIHYYKSSMFKSFVYAYSLGIISSAVLGLFRNYIPMLKIFTKAQYFFIDTNVVARFTGLAGDSNAFSIPVLVAISLLLVLNYYKSSLFNYLLLIVLTLFGLLTVSQMFIICYSIMIIFYLFFLYRENAARGTKSLFIVFLSVAIAGLLNLNYLLDNYLYRFNTAYANSDLNSLTTGRYDIWKMYFEEIISNAKTFFCGEGLSASLLNGFQAHNTYLEIWYKIGMIGIILFIIYLLLTYKYISNPLEKISLINYLPMLILLLSLFSLNNFYSALIIQMLLVMTALKYKGVII